MQPLHRNAAVRSQHTEQQTGVLSSTELDAQIAIGQPEFRLIAAADHRQTNRPTPGILYAGRSQQSAMNILKTPAPPASRTEDQIMLELLEQRPGRLLQFGLVHRLQA